MHAKRCYNNQNKLLARTPRTNNQQQVADINNPIITCWCKQAWNDERLRCDTFYGSAIERWLKLFDTHQFKIIDSQRMKQEPREVLREIEVFLEVDHHRFSIDTQRDNVRKPLTKIGRCWRDIFSYIPDVFKTPIRKMGINIYSLPMLKSGASTNSITHEHYDLCGDEVVADLKKLEELTRFATKHWVDEISSKSTTEPR